MPLFYLFNSNYNYNHTFVSPPIPDSPTIDLNLN